MISMKCFLYNAEFFLKVDLFISYSPGPGEGDLDAEREDFNDLLEES
jgi:hypothetical protein